MSVSRVRVRLTVLAAVTVAGTLAACDPLYQVGARQYLMAAHRVMDSARTPSQDPNIPPAIDVPRLADCLEASLQASPSASNVRRWKPSKLEAASEANMAVALSTLGTVANVHVRARRNDRPLVEVVVSWIGTASKYSQDDQGAMVRATTALLASLRTACFPMVADSIACVAAGLGRRRVCVVAP